MSGGALIVVAVYYFGMLILGYGIVRDFFGD